MTQDSYPTKPPALALQHARRWFKGRGLTQRELSRRTGIRGGQLSRYERRSRLPVVLRHLLLASIALGVPLDDLIGRAERRRAEDEVARRAPRDVPPVL